MSKNISPVNLGVSSLQFKLTVIAVLLVMVPLIIFFISSINSSTSILKQTVENGLVSRSELVVRGLNDFIDERTIDVKLIAHTDILKENDIPRIIEYLSDVVNTNQWVDDIDVIDLSGTIIASSGIQNERGAILWKLFPETEVLFNISNKALEGEVVLSEALILDNGPGLLFLTPIMDASGSRVSKILAMEVNLESIYRLLEIFDKGRMNETNVYIVDNHGKVIISQDPSIQTFDELPDLIVAPQLLHRFSEQAQVGSVQYNDHSGTLVIGTYFDMGEFGITNALDWSLFSVVSLDHVLAPIFATEQKLMLLGGFILLIILLLAIWQARKITIPLLNAAAQARRISTGDYSQLLADKDKSELGLFAKAFNEMAQSRQQAEAALAANESLLRNIIDGFGANTFVGLLSTEGHILMANQSALVAAGLSLEEVLNVEVEESYWFAYSKASKQKMHDAVITAATGEAIRFDIPIRGFTDDTFFWIDLSIQPIFNNEGEVAYLVPSAMVIQERKLAEEKLRQNEENLTITLNSIGDAVISTDDKGLITRMNPAAEQLTGWPIVDALNKPLTEVFNIISAKTRLHSVNPVEKVMQHGEIVGLENHTALISRDGNEYQIADSAAPIRDATENIVGVVLVFRDVTEKYQAEEEQRSSAELFRNVFSMMPASLVLQTLEGVILYCSDEFCNVSGYKRNEIIGHNALELDLWQHPKQRVEMEINLQRDGFIDELEFELNLRDGGSKKLIMSIRLITVGEKVLKLTFAYDAYSHRK